MGWGDTYKIDLFLNKEVYEDKGVLEYTIKELEENIQNNEEELYMYASSNFSKLLIPEEWQEDPIMWLHIKVKETLNTYKENLQHLVKLNLALEHYDTRVSG